MGIVNIHDSINVIDENGNDISVIYINGIPFKGISRDSTLGWEEFVWGEEPTRSGDFSFSNMDTIDVGLVAQCQVNFKYFNIHDFMRFREAIKQRYFQVRFFNVDTGTWMTREMYCSKSQRDKLYYFNPKLVGVLDFTVNLVATNTDVVRGNITITYNENGGYGTIPAESVTFGNQYETADPQGKLTAPSGKHFAYWTDRLDEYGWHYFPTQKFTAFKDVTLYAIWE